MWKGVEMGNKKPIIYFCVKKGNRTVYYATINKVTFKVYEHIRLDIKF